MKHDFVGSGIVALVIDLAVELFFVFRIVVGGVVRHKRRKGYKEIVVTSCAEARTQ